MQLVFEFGSKQAEPVIEAIGRAVGEVHYDIKYRPTTGRAYIPTNADVCVNYPGHAIIHLAEPLPETRERRPVEST